MGEQKMTECLRTVIKIDGKVVSEDGIEMEYVARSIIHKIIRLNSCNHARIFRGKNIDNFVIEYGMFNSDDKKCFEIRFKKITDAEWSIIVYINDHYKLPHKTEYNSARLTELVGLFIDTLLNNHNITVNCYDSHELEMFVL